MPKNSMRHRKKLPLQLGEDRDFATLGELALITGRSRSSVYRDLKNLGIKPKPLINGHIPIVATSHLCLFAFCPWFASYADCVRGNPCAWWEKPEANEEKIKDMGSVLTLTKHGFSLNNILDLVATGFLPCISVPGDYICTKSFLLNVIKVKEDFDGHTKLCRQA